MIGLEHVLKLISLMERVLFRSKGVLAGREAFMLYTGMGKDALNDAIRGGLPCFKLGGKLYGHTDLVDLWFVDMARRRFHVQCEEDLEER